MLVYQRVFRAGSHMLRETTFTFMSCGLHAHKGSNSAHLSRYRTKIKMTNGDTKPLRRSQGQDGKLQLKNLASSESSEISMAVAAVGMFLWCLLIRWRKYFSAAWESDFTSLFLESSFLVTDCRKAAPRHLEV